MHLFKSLLFLASATPLVVAGPRGHALRRRADDNKDSSSSSLPVKDLTPSSSITFAGTAPLGTGISVSPGTTQEVVLTDVVYTTLTTCPVTSLVTSGGKSFEQVTTTISTVTRTKTSTLCTKCVAPPSKAPVSSISPAETATFSLPSYIIFSSSQPSSILPSIGTVSLPASLFTNTVPVIPLQTAAFSSKPEVSGTAAFPSRSPVFPSYISLTVSATSGASNTLEFPGYGIVPSPTSTPGSPKINLVSNATSSIIPVYTAELLGNAYGGGFVGTPSVYVSRLPFPNGPASGVPPGYGSESPITIIKNNVTIVSNSVGASSTPAAGPQSTTSTVVPVTATIASNVSVLFGGLSSSPISASFSKNESSTPTFISLSPFGGRFSQESGSTVVASVVSAELASILSPATVGSEASTGSTASTSVPIGNSESTGANVITALIPATSPAAVLSAEISQVSNAVLSSLAAAGLSTSSFHVQVAVVGSSTTSVVGPPGEITESSFSSSVPIGGVAVQSPALATSPLVPATTVAGVVLATTSTGSNVNIEASPAGSPTSSEAVATIIPSLPADQNAGPLVTLAVGPLSELTQAAGQPLVSTSTPVIVANAGTTFIVNGSPTVVINSSPAVGAIEETPLPIQPTASTSIPLTVANGGTTFVLNGSPAVVINSSPAIGANGEIPTLIQLPVSTSTPLTVTNGGTSIVVNGSPTVVVSSLPTVGANGEILTPQSTASTPTSIVIANGGTAFTANGSPNIAINPSPVGGANGETLKPIQSTTSTPTPVIVANGDTAIAVIPSPVVGANGETLTPARSTASTPTPVIVANGDTAIAVIPSPVVGANGLTSLAVFSTPIAPAAGLTTPAVLLTPIVGANGLTSLAVVATPVVGANGLTSLAIGFETETSPATGQSESAPTPVEGFVLVQSPAFTPQVSGGIPTQVNFAASGFTNVAVPSGGSVESPVSGGSGGGNYSIHVMLGPTAANQFQGSADRLSLGFGVGFFGFLLFLVLL